MKHLCYCSTISSTLISCLLVGILLTNVGCIPFAEREISPITNFPEAFSQAGATAVQPDWWLDFGDPQLNKLVSLAVNDNFTIRSAQNRVEEFQASARQSGASLIPSLDGSGSGSFTQDYSEKTSTNSFQFSIAASYEIDLWGRLRSQRDAALLELQASQEDYHTVAITIIAELAQTWYLLTENSLQLDLLEKQTETNTKILELILLQFRAGKTGVADVLQQRQLVESNSEDLTSLRAEIRLNKHQLAILLGKAPGTLALAETASLPELPPLPETGVPLDLLTTRPDIVSSFLKLKASDYRVAAAIAERFPKLSISASLSSSSETARDLFDNWFSSLAANLFGPLIDGGRRKAEVDRKTAISSQNYMQYGQTILQAIGEVENALVTERELQDVLKSRQSQLQLAADTIVHVGERYKQGAENYQRVLTALLSHQNLQRSILSSKRSLINNRIALYRATSGHLSLSPQSLTPTAQAAIKSL